MTEPLGNILEVYSERSLARHLTFSKGSPVTAEEISERADAGEYVSYIDSTGTRWFPYFQFQGSPLFPVFEVWPGLLDVWHALESGPLNSWDALLWLQESREELGGKSVLYHLTSGGEPALTLSLAMEAK
jgi:hypothetical protein